MLVQKKFRPKGRGVSPLWGGNNTETSIFLRDNINSLDCEV